MRGTGTSGVEVTNISRHGFWVLVEGRELMLPFDEFPWFRDASVAQILNVTLRGSEHLRWPDLDVDLTIRSIEDPDRYPLKAKAEGRDRATPDG